MMYHTSSRAPSTTATKDNHQIPYSINHPQTPTSMNTTSVTNSKGRNPNGTPIKLSTSSAAPDVAVQILDKVYHLHTIELRNCSEFFDKSLSDTWWRPENTHSGPDGIKYRYKLALDQEDPLTSLLEPVSPREDNSDDQPFPGVPGLAKAYSNMFHAFSHKGINCVSVRDFETLVGLADIYCALPAISGAVELQLLKWLADCSKWSNHALKLAALAYKLQLEELYHDAFVHLVGTIGDQKHHFWKREENEDLPETVRSQVMAEFCRICQLKINVDRELIRTGRTVFWDSEYPDEPKFYANGMPYDTRGHSQPTRDAQALLQTNLKFGVPLGTTFKYLTCAKLAKYPWK